MKISKLSRAKIGDKEIVIVEYKTLFGTRVRECFPDGGIWRWSDNNHMIYSDDILVFFHSSGANEYIINQLKQHQK